MKVEISKNENRKLLMTSVKKIILSTNYSSTDIGFEIQGLQKSETFRQCDIEDIVIQSINPKKARGGHYHEQKTEWFLPLFGEATLIWSDKTNPTMINLKVVEMKADFTNPYVLEVPPLLPHWIKNNSVTPFIMAIFNTTEYDKTNPKTCNVKYPIE